jgi:nuclear cap-binding protein subunit 2
MASELYNKTKSNNEELSPYYRNKTIDKEKLKNSCTLYIGNLSYNTTEIQLYEIFSSCGKVKRVIMGLNRLSHSPCGFAFIEYLDQESAKIARKTLMGTILDGKEIRVDMDIGFEEGRQYGRGWYGCQKRDEIRKNYDPDRPWKKNNYNYYRQNIGKSYGGNYRYNDRRYNRSRSRSGYKNRYKSRSRDRSRSRNRSRSKS